MASAPASSAEAAASAPRRRARKSVLYLDSARIYRGFRGRDLAPPPYNHPIGAEFRSLSPAAG